jgi:hypothetical protein
MALGRSDSLGFPEGSLVPKPVGKPPRLSGLEKPSRLMNFPGMGLNFAVPNGSVRVQSVG